MRHFYHLYCGPLWEDVAGEHVQALQDSGADWDMTVGLVGPVADRALVGSCLEQHGLSASYVVADSGWEQLTLRELHEWAKGADPREPVLYAHSKGVTLRTDAHDAAMETVWRRSMTRHLVGHWKLCADLLEDHDAVGCHWLTPETHPGFVETPMFGGNFWWANAGYLASLPPIDDASRFHAEGWVGLGDPKVYDMRPGWPTLGLFATEIVELLNPGALQ